MRGLSVLAALAACGLGGAAAAAEVSKAGPQPVIQGQYRGVLPVAHFDVSPPLRTMMRPVYSGPLKQGGATVDPPSGLEWIYTPGPQSIDQTVQSAVGPGNIPAPIVSFNAQSNISGVNPPDPAGDVGPNHYVAMSNLHFQIFNKTGTSLFGPAATNSLWSGFGGACQTENAGDPIVFYDQIADRWILTQFTAAGPTFFNCVAISQTPDPTGSYYRYAFTTGSNFPDYPKYGMWRDAYLISTREFVGTAGAFAGVGAYALNRAQMLAGNPSPQVISFIAAPGATAYNVGDGLLPADIDGPTLPPAGRPAFFVGSMDQGGPYGAPQDALTLWKFVIDFATPANSSFTLANTIPIAAYDTVFDACSGRQCIPQAGTAVKVDILSYRQRPLNRLAYRNFGTHESLVTNQSVEAAAGMAGIRWWEIRSPNASPVLFQDATYAPGVSDGIFRWMGSIAQDSAGNMALGYSVSSASIFPGIRYTGRLASDPINTMPQGEGVIVEGTGSNTAGGSRWGDYTSMNIDPTDDCTFWYVNQWTPTTSPSGWQLRVGSFRFNECGSPTFSQGATPAVNTVCSSANSATFNVSIGSISGFTGAVTMTASGNPAGSTTSFSPNPVTPPGTTTLTVGSLGAVAAGTYPLTITGTAAGPITRTTNVDLVVQTTTPAGVSLTAPANAATAVSTSPVLSWAAIPGVASYTVEVATDVSFSNIVRTATVSGTSYTVTPALNTQTQYFWRVRAANACGAGANSSPFSFTTFNRVCFAGPLAIPDNTPAGVNADITIPAGGPTLSALSITLDVTHTYVGDLAFTLSKDGGTPISIYSPATTCSGDNMNISMSDAAAGAANTCANTTPAVTGAIKPATAFGALNTANASGVWRLTAVDRASIDTGTINGWCIDLPAGNPDSMFANGFE
ncbi:MAG: hypothetical protein U1F26_18735 [Lysobacterales bacterium]